MQKINIKVQYSELWPVEMCLNLRRITQGSDSGGAGLSAFQLGDIFIDPARQEVTVCGQPVNLRHREQAKVVLFSRKDM